MSKVKLVKQIKTYKPSLNHSEIDRIIGIFCSSIKNALKNDKKVEIRKFGTFFIKQIKERYSARNPKTGELIYAPKKNKIRFKASKNLNYKINE